MDNGVLPIKSADGEEVDAVPDNAIEILRSEEIPGARNEGMRGVRMCMEHPENLVIFLNILDAQSSN